MRRPAVEILLPLTLALAIHAGAVVFTLREAERVGTANAALVPQPRDQARLEAQPITPAPEALALPEVTIPDFEIGEEAGTGKALFGAESELPNVARLSEQEQPRLAVEPKTPAGGDAASPVAPPLPRVTQPRPARPPRVPPAQPLPEPTATDAPADPPARSAEPAAPADAPPTIAQPSPPAPQAAPLAPPTLAQNHPGAGAEELDPAMFAPSDVDAFSTESGVDFTIGGTTPRAGRTFEGFRDPRVDTSFMADLRALDGRIGIVYQIQSDAAGRAVEVTIVRSSGSATIDGAFRRSLLAATYGGKRPDTFLFGITIVVD